MPKLQKFALPLPNGRGSEVVAEPHASGAGFTRVLELCNAAVSTSGDAEQHVEIAGTRYSHIIDPATGIGLTRPISVTVVARRGIDADGLSTAVSVLGAERGMALMEKRPGAAALIVTNRDHVVESARWPRQPIRRCTSTPAGWCGCRSYR